MNRLEISTSVLLSLLGLPSSVLQAGAGGVLRTSDGREITDPDEAAAEFADAPVQSYSYVGSRGEPEEGKSYIILEIHT